GWSYRAANQSRIDDVPGRVPRDNMTYVSAGRRRDQLQAAVLYEPDPGGVELQSSGIGFQRRRLPDLDDVLKNTAGSRDDLAHTYSFRLVHGDAGRYLLKVPRSNQVDAGHDDSGSRSIAASLPGAGMTYDNASVVDVDLLAEVEHRVRRRTDREEV